jgi:hypothetical protein
LSRPKRLSRVRRREDERFFSQSPFDTAQGRRKGRKVSDSEKRLTTDRKQRSLTPKYAKDTKREMLTDDRSVNFASGKM